MPESIMEFPLTFDDNGFQVARSVVTVTPNKEMHFSGKIKEGTIVRFAVEDERRVVDTIADVYVKASLHPLETLFILSCAARKTFFNNHLEVEYKALAEMAPQAGFVTYGEFAHVNGSNHLFNVTSVVLGLSETNTINNKLKTNLLAPRDLRKSANVVSNLIDATTLELNEQLNENRNLITLLKQYQDALDTATLVSKTDLDGIITYSNLRFCDLSGYSEAELIGQPHNIVRHPESDRSIFEGMWKQLKSKKVWSGMLQNRKKDGSSYYVHATIFPILDEHGEVFEYMALREDLTSMIMYEKNLEEQQERLHKILDNQDTIVALSTPEGEVTFLNKKFFDTFDYKNLDDFLSKHKCLCELFVDKKGSLVGCGVDCHLDAVESEGRLFFKKEYMIDKSDNVLTIRIGAKKIPLDKQNMYISTLTDITEIENARLKAEETKNIKSDFLANMSHEIRTPMNGIMGFTGLLLESNLDERQRQYLDVIQNSTEMLLEIVNGILDFSKLEQGKMEMDLKNINLFIEMEYLYMSYLLTTQEKSLTYKLAVDFGIDECLNADDLHLKQVLSNLINNAIKFTPDGGQILVSAKLKSDELFSQTIEFSVEDTGIGISKERQEKIFDAFSQEDTSTTREFGGTGLGLSICASLVVLMGSKINLISTKNEGSKFSFTLKLDKCEVNTIELKDLLRSERIQLVENTQESQHTVAYLKAFGIEPDILSEDDIRYKKSDIVITFTQNEALDLHNEWNQEQSLLICIDSDSELVPNFSNLQIINCYHRCSTRLYNILYQYAQGIQKYKQVNGYFDGSHLHVLVAEDNEVNQMLMEELLKKYSISCRVVANGEEAFRIAKEEKFDLILMDINMPVMNGVEATKKIMQEASLNKETPIVALTSNVLEDDINMFKDIGMYAHISKPVQNSDIHTLLSDLFHAQKKGILHISDLEIKESIQKAGLLLELSPNIMQVLFKKFLLTTESILAQMDKANSEKSYDALWQQAHNLKGASSSLCMNKITDLSIKIENEAKKKIKFEFANEIEQMRIFYNDIKAYKMEALDVL